jgi:hypothetical protein
MMTTQGIEKPFRVGIFSTVAQADRVVRRLRDAGFSKDELAVLCSNETKAEHFSDLPSEPRGAGYTPGAIVTGGLIGATIGGLALGATALVTGGATLLAAGGTVLIGGGAIAGSFTGAMMTRGLQKEIADYYDQAVQLGKILVAVEVHGEGSEAKLARAEQILAEAGAEPVALVEG